MSNQEFSELDAHRVITMSLNKIANFRMQRGGPKLFKDLLVANLIQKAKILVVDEFYSSSRSLTLENNVTELPETNLETENDVFEDETEIKPSQGLKEPRPEITFLQEEEEQSKLGDNNKDDVIIEEVSEEETHIARERQQNRVSSQTEEPSQLKNPNWDENNKENEPLIEENLEARDNVDNEGYSSNRFSTLDTVEFSPSRSKSPELLLNSSANVKESLSGEEESGCSLKRKSVSDEDTVTLNNKKSKRNEHQNGGETFSRKWRTSSLTRTSPHRTKRHTLKRHRSREWSISFDTDSDDDESFNDFSKLKLKEGHQNQASALIDNFFINNHHKSLRKTTDEEQITILSTVFSSSFDGLGLQPDCGASITATTTTFHFKTSDKLESSFLKKTVAEICSKQAKIAYRRGSQSNEHVAAVTA